MNNVLNWVLKRLKEKSTWMGLASFAATVLGVTLAPEMKEAIVTAGTALAGVGLMVLAESKED